MIDRDGRSIAWRHNHAHAELCRAEQPFGKVVGHPDAAVRCRVSGKNTSVERDARPSEALHVGHVGIVIHVGVMLGVFLQDGEDTGRRLASPLAARHWRSHDPALVIVDSDLLIAQRNDRHDWLANRTRHNRLFILKPCGISKIVRRYQGDQAGKSNKTNMRNAQSSLFMLRVEVTELHVVPPWSRVNHATLNS